MNYEAEVLPLSVNGRGKRYGNRHTKKVIGTSLEICIGNNLSPVALARQLNLPAPTVSEWMTRYWFYRKCNNPIVIVLKSKV
jgi:hypothetical protein